MTTNKELNELETGLNEISEFLLSKIKTGPKRILLGYY